MLHNYNDVLKVSDLAQVLGIGKNAAYALVNQRIIASIRLGRMHLIPKQYLIDFFEAQRYNVTKL